MLNIPELLRVIREWDNLVRPMLPPNGCWFAPLSNQTGRVITTFTEIGQNRDMRVRADLKKWLTSVGLPSRSPHKFRHGFAEYALMQAQDMADFKAICMNLMHAKISITDGIYSVLSEQDINDRIGSLNRDKKASKADEAALLRQLPNQLEN